MEDIIREKDGYTNATQLCKSGNKKFNAWYRLKQTKSFIKYITKETGLSKEQLIEIKQGGNSQLQGTWIHPLLATNLAQWISSEFSMKVSLWIEEWKTIKNNNEKYKKEILNLNIDVKKTEKEKEIQLRLHKEFGGEIEVYTDSGYIDLLTKNEIIEIKEGIRWKHAVGQVLVYALEYPKHDKRIHLFNIEKNEYINIKCKSYDISVSYEIKEKSENN